MNPIKRLFVASLLILAFSAPAIADPAPCSIFLKTTEFLHDGYTVHFGQGVEKALTDKGYTIEPQVADHAEYVFEAVMIPAAPGTFDYAQVEFSVSKTLKTGPKSLPVYDKMMRKICFTQNCAISDFGKVTSQSLDAMKANLPHCAQ